ncbi:unnamed protein product [Phaedon cochleariae]|uniref:4-nitrophenylphosphatase n=1 Tax=Phaedon cochleariae TaxID=80249 RepID=A0A9P0DKG7_PHACE|nr:unnamed protein product [Phaedon cochleariae]
MKLLKNLAKTSPEEQARFFSSFDHLLTDMDGVIWLAYRPLPGAVEFINGLKKRGKTIRYVTNNSLASVETIWNILKKKGFDAEIDDLATPIISGIAYLRRMSIDKAIFAIGSQEMKEELRKAGLKVYPDPPQQIDESLPSLLQLLQDDENVGAVFFNFDPNLTFIKMQMMLTFLKRDDCHYIVGPGDKHIPVGPLGPIAGNYHHNKCIEEISGRTATLIAKPSQFYADFINKKFGIADPTRVLFVGDSIAEDMNIATMAGFQKLLVLTGAASIQDVQNWKYPEEHKPEYFVESLDVLNNIFKSLDRLGLNIPDGFLLRTKVPHSIEIMN